MLKSPLCAYSWDRLKPNQTYIRHLRVLGSKSEAIPDLTRDYYKKSVFTDVKLLMRSLTTYGADNKKQDILAATISDI